MKTVRFAVPNGSLQERTIEILRRAGYPLPVKVGRNDFIGETGGVQFFLRDRNSIASLVASCKFDAGITGSDLRVNEGTAADKAIVVIDLPYARNSNGPTKWVLAGPNGARAKWAAIPVSVPGGIGRTVGTERVGLAQFCLKDLLRQNDRIVQLPGKEESAIADGLCDTVFVVTETGSSLAAHGLEVIADNLFISTPQLLIAPKCGEQITVVEEIGLAMRAILDAEQTITVTFDLPRNQLDGLQLPAAVSPTVNATLNPDWIAGQVLVERRQLGQVLRQLKWAGARGVFMQDAQAYMKGGEK